MLPTGGSATGPVLSGTASNRCDDSVITKPSVQSAVLPFASSVVISKDVREWLPGVSRDPLSSPAVHRWAPSLGGGLPSFQEV